jgi:hypothetical protein
LICVFCGQGAKSCTTRLEVALAEAYIELSRVS